ncbi:hypothetical protein [Microbacterium sp. MYb64]|uniref:hypothetical protein n=1 Tax=Microbacterium sp. MYb64 TaxID=1848691 RepID=UPI0011B08719|nr:hypothetical protein [Microbacterium sp. MYb64]
MNNGGREPTRMARIDGAVEAIDWFAGGAEIPELFAGVDAHGWDADVWLLSAMYVNHSLPSGLTHDEVHKIQLSAGVEAPLVIADVNLDETTVVQGGGLGFSPTPGPEWSRVRWADYSPDLDRIAREAKVPPCFRWFPPGSWPANVLPPDEGSLDESSFRALVATLAEQSGGFGAEITALYADGASGDWAGEQSPHVWRGPFAAIDELIERFGCTPSNFWPADRSWFVYTDYDLWATKVSGSRSLIHALKSNVDLDSIDWPSA